MALSFVEPVERRRALSGEAVDVAQQVGDPATLAYAYAARCDALAGPAYVDQRLGHAGEAVRLAQQARNAEMELLGRRLQLVALLEWGDVQAADAEADAFAVLAERLRLPLYLWCVPPRRGTRALMDGRLADCEGLTREVQAVGRRAGSENAAMLAQSQRLCWLLEAGRTEEALQLSENSAPPSCRPPGR